MAGAKIIVGLLSGALALTSDGVHSLSDAGSNIIGLISVHWAEKPADDDHHYGHQKIEVLAATGISIMLFLAAWELMQSAVNGFSNPPPLDLGPSAYIVVASTFAVNLFVATYEKRAARKFNSLLLEADAAHTTSDLFVTATVFVSLFTLEAGLRTLDAAFAAALSIYIAWIGWGILRTNVLALTDAAPLDPAIVEKAVLEVSGVRSCHRIRTRGWEGNIFIDLHVQIDPHLNTVQGHDIVHAVQSHLVEVIDGVVDVLIHTEPIKTDAVDGA